MNTATAVGLCIVIAVAAGTALAALEFFDDIMAALEGEAQPAPFLPEDVQ